MSKKKKEVKWFKSTVSSTAYSEDRRFEVWASYPFYDEECDKRPKASSWRVIDRKNKVTHKKKFRSRMAAMRFATDLIGKEVAS